MPVYLNPTDLKYNIVVYIDFVSIKHAFSPSWSSILFRKS